MLVVQPLAGSHATGVGGTDRHQLNAANGALMDLAKRRNVDVFGSVEKAVAAIKESVHTPRSVSASKKGDGAWELSWDASKNSPTDAHAHAQTDAAELAARARTHQLDGEIAARQRELKELQRGGFGKVTSSDKQLIVTIKSDSKSKSLFATTAATVTRHSHH